MMRPALATPPPRRSALLRLGILCGVAGFAGLASGGEVLAAMAAANKGGADLPSLLTREQLELTGVLAELIIPQTDTPGALAIGAHRTIDHLLAACAPADEQARFRAGLTRIEAVAQARDGKPFGALAPARQAALLHALDAGRPPFTGEDKDFFRQLKAQVAFAYYTSEAGATRELAYLPIPGGYQGSTRLARTTRRWAL